MGEDYNQGYNDAKLDDSYNQSSYNANNNSGGGRPRQPTHQERTNKIQRESIQRDIDKQEERENSIGGQAANVIGQHNYSYDSQTPNHRGIKAWLQKKCQPILHWKRKMHYKLEESSRRRKRIIFFVLFILVPFISFYWGHADKLGIEVENSKVGSTREFADEDEIKLLNEKYDAQNHCLQMNFQTQGTSGDLRPNDLKAQFVLANKPSHKVQKPTMNMVPTFNNHFTVIVHHLYHNFGGIEIGFHDTSSMTVGSVYNAAQRYNNGADPLLKPKENEILQRAVQSGANVKQSKEIHHILAHVRKRDWSNFVIGEVYAKKKFSGYINPTITPHNLALYDLRNHLKKDYSDIRGTQSLIKSEQNRIKSDQGSIRDINKDADEGNKSQEIGTTKKEVVTLKQNISIYNAQIKMLKKDVKLTLSRILHVKNGVSTLPATQKPRPGMQFTNKKH